jgi:multidrug efflux pump subunit AcrA (membrane-fusion protein)
VSKKLLWIVIGVVIAGGAIIAIKTKQAKNAAFVPPVVAPITVSSMTAQLAAVVLTQPAQVSVKAEVEQLLTARLTAQVVSLPVREGDVVNTGDLLAQLDDKSSRADVSLADAQFAQYKLEQASIKDSVDAAKLDLQAQKDTLARLKKLAAVKAASEDQIQQQSVRVAQAEQRLSAAQSQYKAYDELLSARKKQAEAAKGALGYVQLKALQAGIVSERLVQEGDIVTAGTPLIRLVGEGGSRRLLVQLPADEVKPAGVMWQDKLLPLIAWPRASAQGLLTYEARLNDARLIPNQQLALPLAVFAAEGIALPSQCFIPHSVKEAQVLIDHQGKVEVVPVLLEAIGQEGAVTQNPRLVGQTVLCASSDVLIRLMAGRNYKVTN